MCGCDSRVKQKLVTDQPEVESSRFLALMSQDFFFSFYQSLLNPLMSLFEIFHRSQEMSVGVFICHKRVQELPILVQPVLNFKH